VKKWSIDPSHTGLEFAVRHLGISTVRGRFKKLGGTIDTAEDGTLKSVQVTVDPASIDTGDPKRDEHLRSADFFDVERYPEMTFQSTAVRSQGNGRYAVSGDLHIHGQTRPLTFEVDTTSPVTDPWGNLRAAASGTGKINRKDWGLTWNQTLEFGALLVGEDVKFTLEVEAVAATPALAR